MPSSHAKGMSAEKEIAAEYRAHNYLVIRPNWSRFQPLDFFGLFDFIAVHKEKGWVLGQVKSGHRNVPSVIKEVMIGLETFIQFLTPRMTLVITIRYPDKMRGRGKERHLDPEHWVNYRYIGNSHLSAKESVCEFNPKWAYSRGML